MQQLWSVAAQYVRIYEDWTQGSFLKLNADDMEEFITEWWKQLQRISKTQVVQFKEPARLLNYLHNSIEQLKSYMPMISALKMKGLDKRHWNMLGL